MNKNMLLITLIIFSLCSCELSPFEGSPDVEISEETSMSEDSTLFQMSDEPGIFVFETNDASYLSARGYTLWTTQDVNAGADFETLSVTVCKESGKKDAGFGIVFCSQEINGKPFALSVLINASGLYTIGKISDGYFTHINGGWKNTNYINRGYGIKNKIAVSYDSDKNGFILKINGYEITDFTVSEDLSFKGSRTGYVVVIASNESFPNNPVRVTFEKQ